MQITISNAQGLSRVKYHIGKMVQLTECLSIYLFYITIVFAQRVIRILNDIGYNKQYIPWNRNIYNILLIINCMECNHNVPLNKCEGNGCFIIHPIILKEIQKNGNESQKKDAERALESIISIRGRKLAQLTQPMPHTLMVVPKTPRNRKVYDSRGSGSFPGVLKREEGQGPTGDKHVDAAFDLSGDAYALFDSVFHRNSVDNIGMSLVSSVHYVEPGEEFYNNASWFSNQMIYGDTDPTVFKTVLLRTVAAHEMGHGVVQFEGGLEYSNDTGAMNEHFADVFGILAEQFIKKQDVNQSNWLIGEGIWADNINGKALRSMSNPGTAYDDSLVGKDIQPDHMDKYLRLPNTPDGDWGGVHINSGIPNCAFYKASKYIGGNAWETTGLVWYAALKSLPGKPFRTTFQDLANVTTEIASRLFDGEPQKQEALFKAWTEVGLQPKILKGREFINSLISSR
jgi:Zn-dependent metalloprotease